MKVPALIAILVTIFVVLAAILTAIPVLLPDDEAARLPGWSSERAPDGLADLRVGEMEALIVHETPLDEMTTAFTNEDGAPATIADFRGKVVVVNFWATWCAPCRAEMPSIDRLAGEMNGAEVHVMAVSTDRGERERIDAFLEEIGARTLTVYRDRNSELAREAGIFGLPVTLIVGRDGREVARLIGKAEWDGLEAGAVIRRVADSG